MKNDSMHPSDRGRRLLPSVVDQLALTDPTRVFVSIPLTSSLQVNPYPYTKTFEEARQDPFVVLHTSGSTGFPKPVILIHGTVAHHDTFLLLPPPGEARVASALFSSKRVFIGLGLFHSAAMCSVAFAIYSNTTLVIPPPVPMTAELANQAHLHGNLDVSFLSPSILVDIAKNPSYLDNIRRLKHVTYGGGPLPRETGEMIRAQTHLFVNFGATETGYYPLLLTDPEDWEYMSFSSRMGIELRPFTGDLYELVFIRNAKLSLFQGVFSTFPTLNEYRTKDLFSRHPHKPGLWKFEGRSDDVIVCSTGQKVNPIGMEGLVNSHPSVVSAIVCGQGRERVSLLVEARNPPRAEDEGAALIKELWPLIEKANEKKSRYGRITEKLILFTKVGKPMARAGKGTVLRKVTEELYKEELEDMYLAAKDVPMQVGTNSS
ncbi:thioester reductase domain-containing protein [Rutstroemia sp. NJR-2017a BBW]|nr:thioester reductase domain-containing protein [Rutstroemia sp. NJR-2017a BBW]